MNDSHAREDSGPGEADHRAEPSERTFPALPPARGRGFAGTWWGRAWLQALEDTALDNTALKSGRRLARSGAVGAVSVRAGRITAVVADRDGVTHRSDVILQRLRAEEWDRLLDMAAESAGHIAALLDREMPTHLVEDAASAGVDLLPGIGDLDPQCDCGAWDHCGHTAALCYQLARLLDQDPFVLLLLRGRGERELLDELQVRSVSRAAPGNPGGAEPEAAAAPAITALEAYRAADVLPPLPAPEAPPAAPGTPPALDTDTVPAPDVDVAGLEFLASRAAAAAHRMLVEALAEGHEEQPVTAAPSLSADAARLAAGGPTAAQAARLAVGTGRDRDGLARAVRAWEWGGAAGVESLEEDWAPPEEELARARAALEAGWDAAQQPELSRTRNRWTESARGVQLRLGRDRRWWPYRKRRGRWEPCGPSASDPAAAYATAAGQDSA